MCAKSEKPILTDLEDYYDAAEAYRRTREGTEEVPR